MRLTRTHLHKLAVKPEEKMSSGIHRPPGAAHSSAYRVFESPQSKPFAPVRTINGTLLP